MELLSVIGAGASLALGLLGFVAPHAALRLVGLQLVPGLAYSISEVRATYGGIFIGMSTFGASAPADQLYKHFKITAEQIVLRVNDALQR